MSNKAQDLREQAWLASVDAVMKWGVVLDSAENLPDDPVANKFLANGGETIGAFQDAIKLWMKAWHADAEVGVEQD